MPNIYETLIGAPPSGPEQTAATARALRGQQELGILGQLAGDRVLSPLGQQFMGQAEDRAGALQKSRQMDAQRAMTQGYYDQLAAQSQASQAMAARRQAEIERHNRAMEQKQNAALDKAFRADLRSLGKDYRASGLPELDTSFSRLNTTIADYTNDKGEIDLPGVGATGWVPMGALSPEGREVRQQVASLRNIVMKARSGAAVTDPEAARIYEEIGTLLGGSDADIARGIAMLNDNYERLQQSVFAGYEPEVVEAYRSGLGNIGMTVPEGGAPGAPKAPGKPERDMEKEYGVDQL